jgi:protein gp37
MTRTSIEWATDSWNPIAAYDKETGKRGWFCTKVSPGCTNCYAEQWNRFRGNGHLYRVGNLDKVRFALAPTLNDPLHWRKPRRVFVNSMTDLFLGAHTNEMIAASFAVMARAPQHQFLVLTKRAQRMLNWFMIQSLVSTDSELFEAAGGRWPLPNVWLGVSVENQEQADLRIPTLLQVPAAIRFLSCEPLLDQVDLQRVKHPTDEDRTIDVLRRGTWDFNNQFTNHSDMPDGIDWVIAGGESGPDARSCDVQWIQTLVDQCHHASVPVFVKQLGAHPTTPDLTHWRTGRELLPAADGYALKLRSRKGGDPKEWPTELRVRQYPKVPA